MLMVGHLGMGMGWQIPEELWSRVAPLLKLSNKCLIGFSLVQVPPIWILALDIAQSGSLISPTAVTQSTGG